MNNTICLDENYSTTKLLTQEKPEIVNKSEDKFESVLFLHAKCPVGVSESRKGEGGLRTKGYFKKSYEDKPLISIITVVYNGEKYLEETILSVINQTYDNVEYIIIDGGSTDGTLDIIRKYEDQIDYWVSEKDSGIYDAMNKGVGLCGGDIIGLINADDWYELETIKRIAEEYLLSDKRTILHGYLNIVEENQGSFVLDQTKDLKMLKKGMALDHPTVFVPKKIYEKYGLFSTNYKIASDWDLMLRFYLRDVGFYEIRMVMANFRLGGASFTIDKKSIDEKHIIRKEHKIYSFIDKYYVYDLLKLMIFGKYIVRISLAKQSFLAKIQRKVRKIKEPSR